MKRVLQIIASFNLIILLSVGAYAQKVGLLMDSYVIDRWYLDQQLFEKKIRELGGEFVVEVPYGDPDEQVRLGKKMIDNGVDVLVIVPTDATQAAEIVSYAQKADVNVISYDRLILSNKLDFYISYDNLEVGKLQAQYMLNKVPEGNYLLINGPVSDNNAILFRKGQLEVLQPAIDAGKIKVIGDVILESWSELEALMKIDELFASMKDRPDVILAANDAIARGALQTLPEDMIGTTAISGQDAELEAVKAIMAGKQSMTVYKPIQPLAFTAAEVAMKLAKGQEIDGATTFENGDISVEAILLKPVVVDKTNYKETIVKDGHISLSEVMEKK